MSEDTANKEPRSRRGTKRKAEPKLNLPRSGLAKEILDTAGKDPPADEPPTSEHQPPGGASPGPIGSEPDRPHEPPSGPDRIYEFADSLQNGDAAALETQPERVETWVTFELVNEVFALPVSHVQEILRVNTITPVPHAPRPVRGVTNKRGRVLPVVDLRARLGLLETEILPSSRILVVESRRRLLGLLVDAVDKVVRITSSEVQPPPPDVMTTQSDYILGVCQMDDTLAILLDVDRVLVIQEATRVAR